MKLGFLSKMAKLGLMKWKFIPIFLFVPGFIFSQKVEAEPEAMLGLHAKAKTYGLGLGLDFWKWKSENALTFTLGIYSQKDKRETRIESVYSDQQGKDFIYDKKYYCYVLSSAIGYSKPLIKPSQRNRISLRLNLSVGPCLALLKPYYVEIAVPTGGGNGTIAERPYDASLYNYYDVVGEADYFLGLSEMKMVPGVNANIGVVLDFSAAKEFFRAIELSAYSEVYTKRLNILDQSPDRFLVPGFALKVIIGNSW